MGKVSLPLMSALESDGDFSQCPSNLKCCTVGHVQAEKKKQRGIITNRSDALLRATTVSTTACLHRLCGGHEKCLCAESY